MSLLNRTKLCSGCGKPTNKCECNTTMDEPLVGQLNPYDVPLAEELRALRNRCDAVLSILEIPDAFYVVHTLIEDIFESAQEIVDEYCVEEDEWSS